MGDTPQTINRWVVAVDGVIHTIFTVGLTAGSEVIKTYVPWLRLPVISQIFDAVVNKYGAMIDQAIQNSATFMVLNIQTSSENNAFKDSVTALKQAQTTGDQNAIQKARDDFKKNLGNLVHWDGSSS